MGRCRGTQGGGRGERRRRHRGDRAGHRRRQLVRPAARPGAQRPFPPPTGAHTVVFWRLRGGSMSDDTQVPDSSETVEQRRARISRQVRRWCDRARIDGRHPELSDDAAVLLAAGYLDEPTRQILSHRRRVGRRIPSIGGFGALRLLTEEHARITRKASELRPSAVRVVLEYRAAELDKRLRALRSAVVMSSSHYASGVRAMRRERRDGVHLDLRQREALFVALQRTPASSSAGRSPVDQVLGSVLSGAAERVAQLSEHTRVAEVGRRAAERLGRAVVPDQDRFADRYDTLLYLAGTLYDRIDGSAAWQIGR